MVTQLFIIGLLLSTLNSCEKYETTGKKEVTITWENPANIVSGEPLSATQLNATANVAGTFVYTPSIGTVLSIGVNQNLKVDFTPTDTASYNIASKTVAINVKIMAVGDSYQGGKVAYFFVSGDPGYVADQKHGLIASVSDLSTSATWWNGTNTSTTAIATGIGSGSLNTTAIIASQGNTGNYAAKLCKDYTDGTYHDWYLPSKDELNKLYVNKELIGGFASGGRYWSSTESDTDKAWNQYFYNGNQNSSTKNTNTYEVRAIRTF